MLITLLLTGGVPVTDQTPSDRSIANAFWHAFHDEQEQRLDWFKLRRSIVSRARANDEAEAAIDAARAESAK